MSARSTTSRHGVEALPRTARLGEAPREVLEFAARVLQLDGRDPKAIRRALRALHGDRDQVLGLLERLPPLCSLLLEVLVDAGGMLPLRTLNAAARERMGNLRSDLDPYLELLQAHLLVAGLVSTADFGAARERVALMDSVAQTVAPLVGGLTLPVEPPAQARAPALSSEERETLALATVTAHRLVRANQDLTPNRSSVKQLAKSLGIEPNRVMGRLLEARIAGILAEHLDAFRPVVPALREAAALGLGRGGVENDLESWLPASEWVPIERFARARWRVEIDERFKLGGLSWASTPSQHRPRMPELKSRRIEVAEHGGQTWVRRCVRDLRLTGDGHVTPNLEVYLGPSAHPRLVVTIGLGAELAQVDRVLTFRLSPQSVAAGLALGLTERELTEALDRVGPHGAPDVVRQAVTDFVRRARFARVERAYAVHLPADSADAFCAKHGHSVLQRATPQLVLVDPDWQDKDLHRSLRSLGVHTLVSAGAVPGPAEHQTGPEPDRDPASGRTPKSSSACHLAGPEPLAPSVPAPQLVHRLDEDRTAGFATSRDAARTAFEAITGSETEPEPPTAHIGAQLRGAPPAVQDLVRGSQKLAAQAKAQLEAWASRLLPARRAEVRAAQKLPLVLLPYLALKPEWRSQAIAGKTSLTDFVEAASRLCTPSRCSPEGLRLLKEADLGGVAEAAMAALKSAVDPVQRVPFDSLSSRPAFVEEDFDEQDLDEEDLDELSLDEEDFLDDDPEGFAIELPEPDAFPPLLPEQILRILEGAANERDPVFIKLRAPGGSEVRAVLPERFRVRGGKTMLLVVDLETSEGRVLEVSRIESAVGANLGTPIPI